MENKRYILRAVTMNNYRTFGILDTMNGLKVVEEVTVRRSKFSAGHSPHRDQLNRVCEQLNREHEEYEKVMADILN